MGEERRIIWKKGSKRTFKLRKGVPITVGVQTQNLDTLTKFLNTSPGIPGSGKSGQKGKKDRIIRSLALQKANTRIQRNMTIVATNVVVTTNCNHIQPSHAVHPHKHICFILGHGI